LLCDEFGRQLSLSSGCLIAESIEDFIDFGEIRMKFVMRCLQIEI
jgi:hypothetical protein